MKLAWLTDIHLNFLKEGARLKFYQEIVKTNSDAILLTGDIAEAPSVSALLREMCSHVKKPIYFVLGNHDFYKGQVDDVKKEMLQLTNDEALLFWMPAAGCQTLEKDIVLVGQDGWADGRLGDYYHSICSMYDSRMIADLFQQSILGKKQLLEKMQQLADHDAAQLKDNLTQAIAQQAKKIIVLTHIPPFPEASMHKGKMCDDSYLPFFTAKATGDILLPIAKENPTIEFLVLCGHTHSAAVYQPCTNLIVKAGAAEYYKPKVQEIITF